MPPQDRARVYSIAGSLIAAGWFVTPFCLAAVLQAAYVLGYDRMFGRYDRRADKRAIDATR